MPDILRIEHLSFDHPWQEEEFNKQRKKRNCVGLVAEYQEAVIGYILCSMYKNSIHVDNIAILHDARRKGVGTQLIERITNKLSSDRSCVTVDVRESNLDAQLFFRNLGFQAVKIHPEFFSNDEAAYSFVYRKAD